MKINTDKNTVWKYKVSTLMLLGILGLTQTLLAQEQENSEQQDKEPTAQVQQTKSTPEKTPATKAQQNASANNPNNDPNFVPTEEISEDLPVSFPVDI